MGKTFLFVKDRKKGEVVSVYEYDEYRFRTQKILLDLVLTEKRNLERLFHPKDFFIEQVTGEDLSSVARMFPEIVGRANISDLHGKILRTDIFRYKEASYAYYIEADGEDRVVSKHMLECGTIPISLVRREIGVTGGASQLQDYGALKIKASTPIPNEIKVSLFGHPEGRFDLGLNLWPPLEKGETREFTVEYTWKGMWEPFRIQGGDVGSVTASVDTDRLQITIILPPGIDAELIPEQKIGDLSFVLENDRKKIIWLVANAPPGQYSFKVKRLN